MHHNWRLQVGVRDERVGVTEAQPSQCIPAPK